MISVNEGLPEFPELVLCLCDEICDFDFGIYCDGQWSTRTFRGAYAVTHWVPLPEMPEEVEAKMKKQIAQRKERRQL